MKRRTNVKENRVYGAVTYLYLLPLHIHFSIVELLISRLNSSASWTEADTSQTQIAANATTNCRCSYSMNLMHCLPNALLLPVTMAFKKYQQRWWYTHHGGYHAHDNKTSKRQKHNFGWFVMSLPLYCVPCIYTSHIDRHLNRFPNNNNNDGNQNIWFQVVFRLLSFLLHFSGRKKPFATNSNCYAIIIDFIWALRTLFNDFFPIPHCYNEFTPFLDALFSHWTFRI